MRRLDKDILQDAERNRGNDWYAEDNKRYEEINQRSKHNDDRDERIDPNSKYWQSDDKCHKYCRSIRRFMIPGSKWYVFQIQRMLADKLDRYKERGNTYVNENIWEIQELYINKEQTQKDKERVENEEVILIKPYEVSKLTSTKSSSFVDEEVNNLLKYIKFIKSPTQTRIFWLPPHNQALRSREEQDPDFWKEIAMALVENKHNMEISRNGYLMNMFQGGPLHKPFFIAIDNWGQVIIGSNKKMVAIYVVGELEVLVWFMRTWTLRMGYCYDWYLKDATWRWA